MSNEFSFRLIATDGKARRGEVSMPRATDFSMSSGVPTPIR